MSPLDHLRDPEDIYRRSFEIARAETDLSRLPDALHDTALRIVHACAAPELALALDWHGNPAAAGRAALARGGAVLADCRMVADGVTRARLPAANAVHCFVGEAEVAARARRLGTTRSAAAVELWRPHLQGALVAIGNAPTALFRLLEVLGEAGTSPPAAILAFPVGFVGAAESKRALSQMPDAPPYLTIHGRRGGSAMAAAAVNAIARSTG